MNTSKDNNFDALIKEAVRRNAESKAAPQLPADFAERVMARINKEQKVVPFYRRRPVWLGAAAACVAAFVLGALYLYNNNEGDSIKNETPKIAMTQTRTFIEPAKKTEETPQPEEIIAENKPKTKKRQVVVKPQPRQADIPEDYYLDDLNNYTDMAMAETEKAIAMLCKNLNKAYACVEAVNDDFEQINNSIESINSKISKV